MKKVIAVFLVVVFLGVAAVAALLIQISSNLPKLITVADYKPLLISEVYDRHNEKIGEFFIEDRTLVPYKDIPPLMVKAFLAAEDDQFFEHGGINYQAIFRAMLKNIKAGRWAQGGSTITQQVAKTLLLTSEKTLTRKIREALLAYRMEAHLSKEEILYLYFNQIYFGQGAYGVHAAAQTYFRKSLAELEVHEMATLAGLPQAPSRYSPIRNPKKAKRRQRYVLGRMRDVGYITPEVAKEAMEKPLEVYVRKSYRSLAPFYLETVRQMLVSELGQNKVHRDGLKIYTGLDLKLQQEAQKSVRAGLRSLDKRQGFRGPSGTLSDAKQISEFLLKSRDKIIAKKTPLRIINPDGTVTKNGPLELHREGPNLPDYLVKDDILEGVVTKIDDEWGLTYVRFAEAKGLIDIETMAWARKPDPTRHFSWDRLKKPSEALSVGDIISVRVDDEKFSSRRIGKKLRKLKKRQGAKYQRPEELPDFEAFAKVSLEQEPVAEGALLSFDLKTQEIISMVGGYDFKRSEYNRTIQAQRQTGSAFKAIVYASAIDKGYTPATKIADVPLVYEEEKIVETETETGMEQEAIVTRWKPKNHSKKFGGDILFRNALIRSLNVPTVKLIEDIGVEWVADYARRLGIFSPLNMDMTLGLGSSGVTLYEMTKVFSHFARMGKKLTPQLIRRVEDRQSNTLIENISLDRRFQAEITEFDRQFESRRRSYLSWLKQSDERTPSLNEDDSEEGQNDEPVVSRNFEKEPPVFFDNPDQLIRPTSAYLLTSLLHAAVHERRGTGGAARVLGRPLAGKTGSTSDYFDAWFMGFSPFVTTGVWVGYDNERTLGKGEVGGRSALPIWIDYMRAAHEDRPKDNFEAPNGVVFVNIDNETGKLASANSKKIVSQAFEEGTEPTITQAEVEEDLNSKFLKEDLSE